MRKRLLIATAALVAMLILMRVQGAVLAQRVRGGILALEFAGTKSLFDSRLEQMGRGHAVLNTWLDFLFIAAYTAFFVTACCLLAPRFQRPAAPRFFVRLALLAALLDVLENTGMLASIYGIPGDAPVLLAYACAVLKFCSVVLVVLFLVYAWLFRRRTRFTTV